jgi:hypothetical protein
MHLNITELFMNILIPLQMPALKKTALTLGLLHFMFSASVLPMLEGVGGKMGSLYRVLSTSW